MSNFKLPDKPPVLRVVPMPADVNPSGDIFGGWIMSHVDIAGGILAQVHSRGRVVTVAVNSFTFKNPVSVGDRVLLCRNSTRGHDINHRKCRGIHAA